MKRFMLRLSWILAVLSVTPMAQAGIIEDLLAIPAIQSLLGKLPELQSVVMRCNDARYKQREAKLCQQAEEASRLARMPAELRFVMSNPTAAASMRELCLAVQSTPVRNSYLCVELAKADVAFGVQLQQQQQAEEQLRQQQNRESPR